MKYKVFILILFVGMLLVSCNKSTEPEKRVAIPEISPESGVYAEPQQVTITCSTEGATIRYTLNGSNPTEASTVYADPIEIAADTTVKARAFKEGWEASEIAVEQYIIGEIQDVAAPTFDPPAGTYAEAQSVTISCATEGATIRYTTDGNNPTESSPVFSNPLQISVTTTLKARAFKDGWNPSEIITAQYSIGGEAPEIEMVFVQGGTFSPDGGNYNVTLSSYYIGKYEITQAEYLAVMGMNPSWFTDDLTSPVESVGWFNAIEFCNRLSIQEGLTPAYSYGTYGTNPEDWPTGWDTVEDNHLNVTCNWSADGYRLPTEMEWEFAARGGVTAQDGGTFIDTWAGTDVEAELVNYAWYNSNSEWTTHPVGTKLPNELGLFDMSGNVQNWVWDIVDAGESYPGGSFNNPTGLENWFFRGLRSGSWFHNLNICKVSFRSEQQPTLKHNTIGFRLSRISP